ncbi:MAG: hypothetical protein EZS28_002249, partial [Streblomastix strix]
IQRVFVKKYGLLCHPNGRPVQVYVRPRKEKPKKGQRVCKTFIQ